MRVRIFGREVFESKWVPRPRGWIAHIFLCDGQVAVDNTWYIQGYCYAAVYDHKAVPKSLVLDWCQEHAAGSHIIHPSGAVLFKQSTTARAFGSEFGGK
jgi:hypothetical protein